MKYLALAALMLVCSGSMAAAKKTVKPAPRPAYATQPFDVDATQLPASFLGNDCESIGSKLRSLDLGKGEFETTAAYAARLESISNAPVAGGVLVGSNVAFVPESTPYSTYDADKSTMQLRTFFGAANMMVGPKIIGSASLTERETSSENYVGSNAYGKSVKVRKSFNQTCAVGFVNMDQLRDTRRILQNISFQIDPSEAQALGKNMSVAYVGQITAPYYAKYSRYVEPKIDSPYESFWTGDTVLINLAEIIIFDKATGKILHRSKM